MTPSDLHLFSAVLTMLCAGFLIVCPKYHDGVVGRFGLGGMCFVSGMIIIRWVEGYPFIPSPSELGMFLSVDVFMGWHVFRFSKRIIKEKSTKRRASDRVAT